MAETNRQRGQLGLGPIAKASSCELPFQLMNLRASGPIRGSCSRFGISLRPDRREASPEGAKNLAEPETNRRKS